MEHFRVATANRRQFAYQNSPALSAVNAVSLARGWTWEETYRLLLRQAKRYGLLPDERLCVINLLREAGYIQLKSFRTPSSCDDVSDYLRAHYPHITSGMAVVSGLRHVCAIRPLEQPRDGFAVMDTNQLSALGVYSQIWLLWDEIGSEKPTLDEPKLVERDDKEKPPSTDCFQYFQPNPRSLNTGDCVIRAYAALFDLSWCDALELLACSCEYLTAQLNSYETYRYLIVEYSGESHEPPRNGRAALTGREFCAYLTTSCRRGERVFAKLGRDHVAAFLPDQTPQGIRYRIHDSWDSSRRKVRQYFVYTPKPVAQEKPAHPSLALEPWTHILHPTLGEGVIEAIEAEKGRTTILFANGVRKTLASAWVSANCRAAVPEKKS